MPSQRSQREAVNQAYKQSPPARQLFMRPLQDLHVFAEEYSLEEDMVV